MTLPNGRRATVDATKLRDYVLSSDHPRGRHKARVFASALGLTAVHMDVLREGLLAAAAEGDAVASGSDRFGSRYRVDFVLRGPRGEAVVSSLWIVRVGEDAPRFITCWVQ